MDSESAPASLGVLPRERRNGSEAFHAAGTELGFNLLSFWQWSASDVVSNRMQGVLAELPGHRALGAAQGVGEE
jgi:hypothetical protein